ncbi:Fmp52 [Kluyveromyces lactis]|nr:Fmp52 [Kluyveromyces lactis]
MNALVLGATGLCGSSFLKYASQNSGFDKVYAITRRDLPSELKTDSVVSVVSSETNKWGELIPDDATVLLTGLATTRAAAGGFENQYKIDHDMNVELAKVAKAKGYKVCVLVSSLGANENSFLPYLKLKGETERDIIALDFDKTIILRPGGLLGERNGTFKGFGDKYFSKISSCFYRSKLQSALGYPIYGDEVGKVGVKLALDSSRTEKVQIVSSPELLKLAEEK